MGRKALGTMRYNVFGTDLEKQGTEAARKSNKIAINEMLTAQFRDSRMSCAAQDARYLAAQGAKKLRLR